MSALKQHRLVRSDLAKAFHWYEDQSAGLGQDLLAGVRSLYSRLPRTARHHSRRYGEIRRVNLKRFPYGIFYVIVGADVRVLGVLHDRSDHRTILAARWPK